MIGPATSCGYIVSKHRKSTKFLIAAEWPRKTSIDIAQRLQDVQADAKRQRHAQGDIESDVREPQPLTSPL